jgi:hypothetical protein
MKLFLLLATAGLMAGTLPAHSQAFQRLHFHPGQDTVIGSHRLRLEGPDNPAAPTLWEGPLRIEHDTQRCAARVSLVRSVWAAPTESYAIVITDSGSNTYVQFIDTDSCAVKWPRIKAFTEGIDVLGKKIQILPGCACDSAAAPCTCSGAQVYSIRSNDAPALLEEESCALTKLRLGVEFTGTRKVLHPGTPQVHLLPN